MTLLKNQCSVGVIVDDETYVGYGNEGINIAMIVFSILGILINSVFTFNYSKQIHSTRKNKSGKKVSAIEIILCTVAGTETLISICWLINNLLMNNTKNMYDHCLACTFIAHFEILLYLFDWMFLSFSLYHMKKFLDNPEELEESWKKIIKYIFVCLIFSFCSLIFSILANIGGVSPLLTCFINIQILETPAQYGFFWVFFLIPLLCILSGLILVIYIRCSKECEEKSKREYFDEFAFFVIIYMLYSIILIGTYIANWILIKSERLDNHKGSVYRWIICCVTMLSCSSPLVVGLIRMYRTRFFCRKKSKEQAFLKDEDIIEDNPLANSQKNILQELAIKYFAALSYSLGKSKNKEKDVEEEKEDTNKNINIKRNDSIVYCFSKDELLKDNDIQIDQEEISKLNESNLDIEIIEYNNSEFKKLRELEGLNEDKLLEMFQPKKGIDKLIHKKNDTFYINSINKLLMLREIKKNSLTIFQRNLLPNLYDYFSKNPDSIICRIFGLYKIKIDPKKEVYMALMYNINESFENLDLKDISNCVREMKINENELKENIVTDNNQKDKEKNKIFKINLKEEEKERLNNIIKKDIAFLDSKKIDRKFLVFERNIERFSINMDDSRTSFNFKSKATTENIKKYKFDSNLNNTCYSICIMDYFKNM